jgi:proteasome lid subunit RPN8/RPN11
VVSPVHPGPAAASIPATIVQSMIDHARTEVPNEACGLIVGERPAGCGWARAALRADAECGGVAVPL